MLRYSNRIAQTAVYKTGTPNYVELGAGAAAQGYGTVAYESTQRSWEDGDTTGILVFEDASKLWVGTGTWRSGPETFELTEEEFSIGSLTADATVLVTLLPIASQLRKFIQDVTEAGQYVRTTSGWELLESQSSAPAIRTVTGTDITILPTDNGNTVVGDNSGTKIITIPRHLDPGFTFQLVVLNGDVFVPEITGEPFQTGSGTADTLSLEITTPTTLTFTKLEDGTWAATGMPWVYDGTDPRYDPMWDDVELLLDFEGPSGGLVVADTSFNQHPVSAVVGAPGELELTDTWSPVGQSSLKAEPTNFGTYGYQYVSADMGTFDLGTDPFVIEFFYTPIED